MNIEIKKLDMDTLKKWDDIMVVETIRNQYGEIRYVAYYAVYVPYIDKNGNLNRSVWYGRKEDDLCHIKNYAKKDDHGFIVCERPGKTNLIVYRKNGNLRRAKYTRVKIS
jgi:hypothetical protein